MTFNKINPINYNFHKISTSGTGRNVSKIPSVSIITVGFYLNKAATAKMLKESDYYEIYFDNDNDIVLFAISDAKSTGASKIAQTGKGGCTLSNKAAMHEVTNSNPQLNLRNYSYKWELEEYIDDEFAGFIFKPKIEPYSKKLRNKPMKF